MDTYEFLGTVLPDSGLYCVGLRSPLGMRHKFFTNTDELAAFGLANDAEKNDLFFALSTFKSNERKQTEALYERSIVLDLDIRPVPTAEEISKSYLSLTDAGTALTKFIADTGLPAPLLNYTGRGIHAYIVLSRDVTATEWQPLANGVKALWKQHGLRADPSVTADSARLLRLPGSTNSKSQRASKVLTLGTPIDPADLLALLPDNPLSTNYIPPAPAHITTQSPGLADDLLAGTELPPADADLLYQHCAQIKWGVDNQAEPTLPEPFWYAMLGMAAYCIDPEATAVKWSEQYPQYDRGETLTKMHRWKATVTGAPRCENFRDHRPDGCEGCPQLGNINSPVGLGIRTPEIPQPTAPVPTTVPAAAPATLPAINVPLPRPYVRTVAGIKVIVDGVEVTIAPFDIYPVSYGYDESLGYEVVRFHWDRPHVGWKELKLRHALLTTVKLTDFTTEIADQGIVLETKDSTANFQIMLRKYMDSLRQLRTVTNLYSTMGWKDEFREFVIGDVIYRRTPNGTVEAEQVSALNNNKHRQADMWQANGTLDGWRRFARVMQTAKLLPHMFAVGVSMSAPLYKFTGLNGVTVSLLGRTGGGKTVAQLWAQSVWGRPEELHFAAKFTLNALFTRMSTYCHLPITVDEATEVSPAEASDFLYWVSQGRDKARLDRNAQERTPRTWAAPTIISTNRAWVGKLDAHPGDTTPQKARLLEVKVPVNKLFQDDTGIGRKIVGELNKHHGHMGHALVQMLMEMGPEQIKRELEAAPAAFEAKYNCKFSGAERFWEVAVLLADYMLHKALAKGLIDFDPSDCIRWAIDQAGDMRRAILDNYEDSFSILATYLNETASATVTAMYNGPGKPVINTERLPRSEVHVRYNLHRDTAANSNEFSRGNVQINQTHMKMWLVAQGYDWSTLKAGLGSALINNSRKAYLAKDTGIRIPQTNVLTIDLTHSNMRGILTDAEDSALASQLSNVVSMKETK